MISNLILGFQVLLDPSVLLILVLSVMLGILIGVLPGIGPAPTVALLLPFTYDMPPLTSLIMLCSVYLASQYGGSITSIAIGVPGEASSAATILDGFALTKKGFPGKALGVSLVASCTGGMIGTLFLIALSWPLVNFALKFGPAEYFALACFGLSIVSSVTGPSIVKGFVATFIGLFLATIGMDQLTGNPRLTFGITNLIGGIDLVPLLVGLFAVSEVFKGVEEIATVSAAKNISSKLPNLRDLRSIAGTTIFGSLIGTIVGAIPGAGATIASFIAYNEAKRFSKKRAQFGKGCLEGVAAPESANNASVAGALIPLLTLGIPGSATTAVLIGAFMIQGLRPGHELFMEKAQIVYGLFSSMLIANFVMFFVGLLGTKLWIKAIKTPPAYLFPIIFAFAFIGAYSINSNPFDIWVMMFFGFWGYLFKKLDFPVVATVIAFVLEPLAEMSFRRALILSDGNLGIFVTEPISLVLIILAFFSFVYPLIRSLKK